MVGTMIEQGDRIYRDEMMTEELCGMCLTHRKLRRVEHTSANRKVIHVCDRCIEMNGHRVLDED